MDNNYSGRTDISKMQNRMLSKGKTKRLSLFERIPLIIAGRSDGSRGLPRLSENGDWTSAILNREVHSYKEFCDKAWGKLQIDIAERFSKLGYLIDEAKRLEANAEKARERLDEAAKSTSSSGKERKHGEERLSESQVGSRRSRERAKQLQPLKSAVQNIESEVKDCLREAIMIKSEISEANKAVRLVCKRVMDHTRQRMDVYWNSSMRTHPEGANMPVIPSLKIVPDAELLYFKQHKSFLEDAEGTIEYLNMKYDVTNEKEVA